MKLGRRTMLGLLTGAPLALRGMITDAAAQESVEIPKNLVGFRRILYEQIAKGQQPTIDGQSMQSARKQWRDYYLSPNGRRDVHGALGRMLGDVNSEGMSVFETLKTECTQNGIDFNVLFLAIVESRYQRDVVSRAGAAGHFQWIEETARHPRYGLIRKNAEGVLEDHRTDPLAAGRAMIQYLKFFRDTFFGGAANPESVRLSVLAYNGSFPHTYARHVNRQNTSVDGYVSFMQTAMRSSLERLSVAKSYVVKPGDTLVKIARAHGMSLKDLVAAGLDPKIKIKVGETIQLPALAEPAAPPAESLVYTVKKGDNLIRIARAFSIPLEELIALNPPLTTASIIKINDQIIVGVEAPVKPGVDPKSIPRKMKALSHHLENIDYLAKVEAMIDVVSDPKYFNHPSLKK
jgi:LysM repeat protein